jgi:hypothetical protein
MQEAIRHKGHSSLCTVHPQKFYLILYSRPHPTRQQSHHSIHTCRYCTSQLRKSGLHRRIDVWFFITLCPPFDSTGSCSTRLIRQLLHIAECVKGQRVSRAPREVNILSSLSLTMASHFHDYKCNPDSNIQNRIQNPRRQKREREPSLRRLDQVIYHQHHPHR